MVIRSLKWPDRAEIFFTHGSVQELGSGFGFGFAFGLGLGLKV